jgi:antitoxin CptB
VKERERIRWRCRRGLLELDIVLARFLDQYLDDLDASGIGALDRLLLLTDPELLDLIMGRWGGGDPEMQRLASLLRAA